VHVVLRTIPAVGGLRCKPVFQAIRAATQCAAKRADFRIVQLSIQRTHVHMLVEADDKRALARGMQGFQISAAKHINAMLSRGKPPRRGAVFSDRYHATIITSPRQARHALTYVLCNWRKHGEDRDARLAMWKIDVFSSATAFKHWAECDGRPQLPASYELLEVRPPCTWLLQRGWKLHGETISCHAVPTSAPRA
jgi:putative transposase